jgi:hypothetical protein
VLDKYIDSSGALDYTKLWKDVADITGFGAEKRRELYYKEVVDAYNTQKITDNTPTRDRPTVPEGEKALYDRKVVDTGQLPSEEEVVDSVNKRSNRKFEMTDYDQFCDYDAYDDDYLVEVKVRRKWYPDTLIEHDKMERNIKRCQGLSKEFLYIVATNEDIYVFNVSKLLEKDYKFRWDWKEMPKNTDFGGSEDKIVKFVGFIDVSEASVHYNDKS